MLNRTMHAGLLLLLLLLSGLPGRAGSEEIPSIEDPTRYLERQVLIPFRLWDAGSQEYVTDPHRILLKNFRIRENRKEQVPLSVDLERRPLSMALVVDISGSMEESLPMVRKAARQLGNRLKPKDRVAILSFNREVLLRSDLTTDRQVLRRNLVELHPWGYTAVYDAIQEALETLKHEPDPRAIIVLTDGEDNRSTWSLKEVAGRARQAQIPLFFISHKVHPASFGAITQAARETGGRVFYSLRNQDFLRIFRIIADGLRNTFLLAYRPTAGGPDGSWRSLELKYAARRRKIDTWKTGYFSVPDALEAANRPPHPTAPLRLQDDGSLAEPYPRELCPERKQCGSPLSVAFKPGITPRLEVRGWVDLGHDMGEMVDPDRYIDPDRAPDDPAKIDFKYFPFRRAYAWPGHLAILLPPPDDLPRSPADFWTAILSSGAVFHVMGSGKLQPLEQRSLERTLLVPAIPGLDGPATGPMHLWWPDGRITMSFRESLSRWIFHMAPDYHDWVHSRYQEATAEAVNQEFQSVLGRIRSVLPAEIRNELRSVVEGDVQRARSATWEQIVGGGYAPTAHLLPRRADVQAADWLAEADAVLVDRLLAGPAPDRLALERDWLTPAALSWSRLRTFFLPNGHHSLVPGIPFLDDETGEIYFKRVILPWMQSLAGGERHYGRFPAPVPAGLQTVAELMEDHRVASALTAGMYRCHERGVSITPDFSREVEQKPAEWLLQIEALKSEKDRLRQIRRQLDPQSLDWISKEQKVLDRELRYLRRRAGTLIEVQLDRNAAPGIGVRLFRELDGPILATPLQDPGLVLESPTPMLLADLPALAERNGVHPSDPAIANAFLVALINGLDGPALVELLSGGGPSGCLAGESYGKIRLRWSGAAPSPRSPVRLLKEDGSVVLEMNLAGTTAGLVQDAMAGLCLSRD